MAKKLYSIRCTFDYAVLAESEREAYRFADKASQDTPLDSCCVVLVPDPDGKALRPMGWDRYCLVYGEDNIKFVEAREAYEVGK